MNETDKLINNIILEFKQSTPFLWKEIEYENEFVSCNEEVIFTLKSILSDLLSK
jgi:hypothetical protein